jgi:mRNA (guanine-N7-)-methyltransferase
MAVPDRAAAYDRLAAEEHRPSDPETSPIRRHNAWVKGRLISRFCPPRARVFDCACGTGFDVRFWKLKQPVEFLFADLSFQSLRRCYAEFLTVESPCRARFLGGDVFACRIDDFIPPDVAWDIASCQFALQYAFGSEALARNAVRNLCARLAGGGYVIITVPAADQILLRLRQGKFGNSRFSLERRFSLDDVGEFGAEYVFYMEQSVDSCPEYLVRTDVLMRLFEECDCELVESMSLNQTKRGHGGERELPPCGSDFLSLYSYFVFKKRGCDKRPPVSFCPEPESELFDVVDVCTGEVRREKWLGRQTPSERRRRHMIGQ